ncbi:MAG: XrtA system polysaccharide chain length determinant [Syntrophaceae bacterium]
MINPEKSYNMTDYLEILRRRVWFMVVPFIVVLLGISVYCIFAPREYKATTLVLVTPQRVPEAFVPTTVTARIEERLQTIAQEVMSRTRLEQIINEMRLYQKERKNMSAEEVVELMQKNIKLELPTKKEERGYFTINYMGEDPQVVTSVANRLASLFIEENLKVREQQAMGTTEFLSTELTAVKATLDAQESQIAQYKKRFMGELPEQRDTNLKIFEQLQTQAQRIGESLRAAQDRKLFLQKQLSDMESGAGASYLPGKDGRTPEGKSGDGTGSYETQKEALTRQLQDLRTKYTETHPDVISTKKKLADLEKNKDTYNIARDPRYREVKGQLAATELEIKRLHGESDQIARQIGNYRSRIEKVPMREQDMASLMREYQNTKETYERLLKKSQDAQQAENLERRQKGEQFKVIDPARVPEKPFSPNIPKLYLIGLALGIAAGFATAFLVEQSDRTFHEAGDLEKAFGLKVLANIPRIEKEEESGFNVRNILWTKRKTV